MRLIDADALIMAFCNGLCGSDPKQCGVMDANRHEGCVLRKYTENAPAVDAVPVRHGRWIKMTGMMPPEYHGHYECSECQWHMKGLRNSWTREEEMAYCPNCGAKMDGGETNG